VAPPIPEEEEEEAPNVVERSADVVLLEDFADDAGGLLQEEEDAGELSPPESPPPALLPEAEDSAAESSICTNAIAGSSEYESEPFPEHSPPRSPLGRSPSLSDSLPLDESTEEAYDSSSFSPAKQRSPQQEMAQATRLFPRDPLKALKMAASARGHPHSIAETVEILTTEPGFDPQSITSFLLEPRHAPILRQVLSSLVIPGDFLATLRQSLGGTPFWVPDEPDALERVLDMIAEIFTGKNPGVFAVAADAALVAFALVVASEKPPSDALPNRLVALMKGDAPTEAECARLLEEVAARPFLRRPANPAPRFYGWGHMHMGKGPDKGGVSFIVLDSLCLFFFKSDREMDIPESIVQLFGFDLEVDKRDPLRIALTHTRAFPCARHDGSKQKAVAGVKKVEITFASDDLVKKWVSKLKRAALAGMFVAPRRALDIPAFDPPPPGVARP
jgi:hypothetical protein